MGVYGALILALGAIWPQPTLAFANCLTQIWAGLPRVSGPNYGLSHYDGIAGNKAQVTPERFLAALGAAPTARTKAQQGDIIIAEAEPYSAQILQARYARIRAKMLENQRGLHRQVGNQIIYAVDPYRVE